MYRILSYTVLFSCAFTTNNNSPLVIDYYQTLIERSKEQAKDFELPKNKAEFQEGYDSAKTIDVGSYDFIIVGAGTAGSVLATRLSEIDSWNILLLEAGGEENDFSEIPAMAVFLPFSQMNWGYYTTPQTNCCLGMKDRKCVLYSGKAIGGSSAINMMVYSRGNRHDFDEWVRLGNLGWTYEDVLPYFIRSENSHINGDSGYHGVEGLWNVEYNLPPAPLFTTFVNGSSRLIPTINDYNGATQLGVSKMQLNLKQGRRQSTGTAFLSSARPRMNLQVITGALVTKVVIDNDTKAAQSVIFVTKDMKFSANASKEIILSGGALSSPQLLMLSGIGPREHLEELDIDVIENLPVGQSLIDHTGFLGLTIRTNSTIPSNLTESYIPDYLMGYGAYTVSPFGETVSFIHAGDIPESVPMLEVCFIPPGGNMVEIAPKLFNFNEETVNLFLMKKDPTTDVDLPLLLLHGKSRGNFTLQSNNPMDFPNINMNLLSDPEDIELFLTGIEFVLKLLQTEDFQRINATLLDFPICLEFEKLSREYWICVLRHMTTGFLHLVGTTPMGPDSSTSVVNSDLEVHGIDKLRVVDAGVIPTTMSGPIIAPTVMIAEKISDVIKNKYGL